MLGENIEPGVIAFEDGACRTQLALWMLRREVYAQLSDLAVGDSRHPLAAH